MRARVSMMMPPVLAAFALAFARICGCQRFFTSRSRRAARSGRGFLLLRQVDSLRAGLQLVGDRVDHLTMITPAATPLGCPVRE
jgi:hypothetical protein